MFTSTNSGSTDDSSTSNSYIYNNIEQLDVSGDVTLSGNLTLGSPQDSINYQNIDITSYKYKYIRIVRESLNSFNSSNQYEIKITGLQSVSYTHLTLPTKRIV